LDHQTGVVGKVTNVIENESNRPNECWREDARLGKHDSRIATAVIFVPAFSVLGEFLLLENTTF